MESSPLELAKRDGDSAVGLESRCSRCGDVVMYCDCPYTDPAVVNDRDYTNNTSFEIYRGGETVEWEASTRSLYGSKSLVDDIMRHLTGERVEVLIPGLLLWLSHKDPYAVHFVAEKLVGNCTFSIEAPNWSKYSKPDEIY